LFDKPALSDGYCSIRSISAKAKCWCDGGHLKTGL